MISCRLWTVDEAAALSSGRAFHGVSVGLTRIIHEVIVDKCQSFPMVRGRTRRGALAAPKGTALRADRTGQEQAVERAWLLGGGRSGMPCTLDSLFLTGPAAKAPPRRYLAAWQRLAAFFRVPVPSARYFMNNAG